MDPVQILATPTVERQQDRPSASEIDAFYTAHSCEVLQSARAAVRRFREFLAMLRAAPGQRPGLPERAETASMA